MISIIMPLYNAENFLEEAIESIRKQSYKDFELICIDDASDDATVSIIEKVMERDERIRLLHNVERSGAAISRNKGMQHAKGEYITFLDGDDIFEEEMLERAYNLAKQHGLDIAVYEYMTVDSEKIYQKRTIKRDKYYKEKYCSEPFCIYDMEAKDYISWSNGPCNKLYNKEFIERNKLQFQTLSSSNDVYFVEMALLLAEKMLFLNDERVMVYARNHATQTRISYNRDPMCTYYASMRILEELVSRNLLSDLGERFYSKCYFILLSGLSKTKTEEQKRKFCEFLKVEGIHKMRELGGEIYKNLPECIKESLEYFENKDYDTRWFEKENKLSFFIRRSNKSFIDDFKEKKNIVIWGAGIYGKNFIEFMDAHEIDIKAIVDINKNKQGTKIGNHIITNFETIDFAMVDVVVVAARGAYEEVKRKLEKYELEIISIEAIIEQL